MYTEIQRGRFVSTGASKYIPLVTGIDWMQVWNYSTIHAGPAATTATYFDWDASLADNDALITTYTGAGTFLTHDTALHLAVPGFRLYDSSSPTLGAPVAVTAISADAVPRVTCASTATLTTGDIVRLINTQTGAPAAQQFGGLDFTISVHDGTHFDLLYGPQIVAGAGMTASFRKLDYDTVWYPRRRYIKSISQAANAVVVTTVTHGYSVGDVVRFSVSNVIGSAAYYGMTEIHDVTGTVTAVDTATNSFTTDIDTTAFTAFAWPTTALATMFTPATVCPIGINSQTFDYTFTNPLVNSSARGIILGAGAQSPAGVNTNVIIWRAGKSNI
jgi:opacity protein-like surface antigen